MVLMSDHLALKFLYKWHFTWEIVPRLLVTTLFVSVHFENFIFYFFS